MGLEAVFCALAGMGCHVVNEQSCKHYHQHDIFTGALENWKKLKAMQHAGAEACGFTKYSWNEPKRCRHCFEDLEPHLQQAVLSIGTDAHCWDQAVEKFQGFSHCVARELPIKKGKHCVPSFGVHNTSYVAWNDLSWHAQEGATSCGYNIASWDGPVDCVACFEDLSIAKKKQLQKVGWDHARCWDKLMIKQGMQCDRLMKEIPKFEQRKQIYADYLKAFSVEPSLRTLSKPMHEWSSPSTLGTISLFALVVSFALCALFQLKDNAMPPPHPERFPTEDYRFIHCDDDDDVFLE
jgi:hypothetical protein